MKDLKITKGEWRQCCEDTKPHFVFAGEDQTICSLFSNEKGTKNYEPREGIVTAKERIANAALIADAGNTYQRTGLLPSQMDALLIQKRSVEKQNKRLLEALKELCDGVRGLPPLTAIAGVLTKQYEKAQLVIKKAEQ